MLYFINFYVITFIILFEILFLKLLECLLRFDQAKISYYQNQRKNFNTICKAVNYQILILIKGKALLFLFYKIF